MLKQSSWSLFKFKVVTCRARAEVGAFGHLPFSLKLPYNLNELAATSKFLLLSSPDADVNAAPTLLSFQLQTTANLQT